MTDSFTDRQFVRSNFTPKPPNNKVIRLTYINDFIVELSDAIGGQLDGEDLVFAQQTLYDAWENDDCAGLYAKDDHGNPSIHEPTNPPLTIGLVTLALTDAGYTVLVAAATRGEK